MSEKNEIMPFEQTSEFILYTTPNGAVQIEAFVKDETIWLTQKAMAELFGVQTPAIAKHLKNIYEDGELEAGATISKMETVRQEGERTVNRKIDFYNLDAITTEFYATVQNKFHYAITGRTAAEIILCCANRDKEHMGLTTWKNAPEGRILKMDVTVAKNYLDEKQIRKLERTVTGYFDYVEDLIEDENTFTMEQFAQSINEFLSFRRYEILESKGKVRKSVADAKAVEEYTEFNKRQKIESDFDKVVKQLKKGD